MKYSLKRFLQNIIYLAKYNLKEIDRDSKAYINNRCNFATKLRNEIKNDFDIIKPPRVKTLLKTMQELVSTNKSIIRFGDGEYILMGGRGIPFQRYDKRLAEQLITIISQDNENLLIGIDRGYFHTPSPNASDVFKKYSYSWVIENYEIITKYLKPEKEYANARISQIYVGNINYDYKKYYDLFKQLLAKKKLLLICGDKVLNVKYNILENSDVNYIYGPTLHAYNDIERLRIELKEKAKDETLLFAIGPAGKVLAYEMFLKGYRVLDIGHAIKDYDTYMRGINMTEENIKDFFAPDD